MRPALLLALLLLAAACSDDDGAAQPNAAADMAAGQDMAVTQDMPGEQDMSAGQDMLPALDMPDDRPSSPRAGLFGPQVERVAFEVDYQTGAEPFTGRSGLTGDTWELFSTNIERLFERAQPRQLVIPTTLAQMQELTALTRQDYTAQQLLDLAAAHRTATSTVSDRRFYIVFLNAYFRDQQDMVRRDVLGVSIGDTGVIAMFKPVISSTGSARMVEQTTLVHEVGHAFGLVNNGVATTSDHHDEAHGAHCDNRDCVMYYLNESASDIEGFVGGLLGGPQVIFGPECLADIDAAAMAQ